ncbi:MAG: hypothetical protein AABY54_08450 [Deltaproteobacteria bacterium]
MKQYLRFHNFSPSQKLLCTFILLTFAIGYSFGMTLIWETHAGLDGKSGLSPKDIVIAYRGDVASRLELALRGPMSDRIDKDSSAKIYRWIESGAEEKSFNETIKPILESNCVFCHNGSNPHIPNLTTYENVKKLSVSSTGVTIGTLVRVSHIHLFGLTFIFAFTGIIFSLTYVKIWIKRVLITLPFISIYLDIGSWWITKVSEPFAYVVIIGGALMGFSFTAQFLISMRHMWFYKSIKDDISSEYF